MKTKLSSPLLLLVLALRLGAQAVPGPSQDLPAAIARDPVRDSAHPMRSEAVWIPSGGALMNGLMYVASGAQPHPTVLLLHGLPGNEQNLDLAQSLRRAGYSVLTFHYRGSWGFPGRFSLANGVDDGQAAMAFLEAPVNVAKFHIDRKRLVIIGHSYGGFVATRIVAAHRETAAAVLIAPWSPAEDMPALMVAPGEFAAAAHRAFDDVEGRLGGDTDLELAHELLSAGGDWHLESSASRMKSLPLLIVAAGYDSPDDQARSLISSLRELHASNTTVASIDTDHAFSDHRIALQSVVLKWLKQRAP